MTTVPKTRPVCLSCGRRFIPGEYWGGANYCRGLYLLSILSDYPGFSAAELAEACGMGYTDAARGMTKLRDLDMVLYEREEKEQGGYRYRFSPRDDHQDQIAKLRISVRQVEDTLR